MHTHCVICGAPLKEDEKYMCADCEDDYEREEEDEDYWYELAEKSEWVEMER